MINGNHCAVVTIQAINHVLLIRKCLRENIITKLDMMCTQNSVMILHEIISMLIGGNVIRFFISITIYFFIIRYTMNIIAKWIINAPALLCCSFSIGQTSPCMYMSVEVALSPLRGIGILIGIKKFRTWKWFWFLKWVLRAKEILINSDVKNETSRKKKKPEKNFHCTKIPLQGLDVCVDCCNQFSHLLLSFQPM